VSDPPARLGQFIIAADHPALPGHFPGNPIVPGVVLLDETLALIRGYAGCNPSALRVKFTAVVKAGEMIEVLLTSQVPGVLNFAAIRDGQKVMSGSLRLDPPA
jgi:3-hydroxymyristoyl/3-hydroxydecanoyl-(acyl carrier protein) dehydratase